MSAPIVSTGQKMPEKLQGRFSPDAMSDMQYEILADSGQEFYMFLPRKYFYGYGIRLLLIFLVCVLACYKYFAIPTPPLFILAFRKFHGFCLYLQTMNVSVGKLRILLGIWLCICIVLHFFFWKWIRGLL